MNGNEENKMEQGLEWLEKQLEHKDWEKVWPSEKSLVEEFDNRIRTGNVNEIKRFDMRNNFLKKVICVDYKDNEKYSNLHTDFQCKFRKELIENEIDGINVLALSAFGKVWAYWKKERNPKQIVYDEDALLLMNYIYCKVYDPFKKDKGNRVTIVPSKGYKYIIQVGEAKYFGDTINSWSTTVNEFMRVCGKGYIEGWRERCIPEGYNSWEDFLCVPCNSKKLPPYIMDFMDALYTIGNFMPVPQFPVNFNMRRNKFADDYWDLTLLAIYDYYRNMSDGNKYLTLGLVLGGESVAKWLNNEFGTWDDFVEKNFMQPFVKKISDKRYGEPYELWDGHFAGDVLPKEEWQFEQFFVNARIRILERGKLVAQALIDSYNAKETP